MEDIQNIQDVLSDLASIVESFIQGEDIRELASFGLWVLNDLEFSSPNVDYARYCLNELFESKDEIEVFVLLYEFQNSIVRICSDLGLPSFI